MVGAEAISMVMVPAEVMQRRLTLADYDALPDDQDYEIIDGVLYVALSPIYGHQGVIAELTAILVVHAGAHDLGRIIPDADLIFDPIRTYVSPDLMFFSSVQVALLNMEDRNSIVPTLCVEALSDSTGRRDEIVKHELYQRLAVPHYWILNHNRRSVRELVLGADGRYVETEIRAPDVFRPTLFPDLAIDLERLFR